MDTRHMTLKKPLHHLADAAAIPSSLSVLLEDGAREAYTRPWHRLERGLRLSRLRLLVEEITPQYALTAEERGRVFEFLQKSLDKRLLNTSKNVVYSQELQRIQTIKGLEIKRSEDGQIRCGFVAPKKPDGTRKKKKEPSVSVVGVETTD